ncbi:MAG: winged helix-turn-helix domain-containing protein [Cypionkella sp.]
MDDTDIPHAPVRLQLRIFFGEDAMLGPGKAELLERIRDTGSISAAGRAMGMSYKRAWMLVEEMNAAFREALVESSRGGPGGGGARVTEAGLAMLRLYRSIEATAAQAGADDIAALHSMLRDIPGER